MSEPHNHVSAGNATSAERNAWADELQALIAAGEIPDNEMHKATTVLNLLRIPVEPQTACRFDQDGQTCPTCGRVGNGEG